MYNDPVDFRNVFTPAGRFKSLFRLMRLAVSTGLYNIIRLMWSVVIPLQNTRPEDINRLVVLGSGGIGNHLMLYPVMMDLRRAFPDMYIHFIVSSAGCKELLTSENSIADAVSVMNIGRMSSLRQWLLAARTLKEFNPDAVLAAAGTEPVRGSIISFLSGARIRVGEQWRGRAMFYTHAIRADATVSETLQNFNLAESLGVTPNNIHFPLTFSSIEKDAARQEMRKLAGPGGGEVIGVHAGSGREQKWKRWPFDHFLQTALQLTKSHAVRVVFFIGPDEEEIRQRLVNVDPGRILVYDGRDRLRQVAAMIGCCDIFLSNDSGLLHIASSIGVKTLGLFGPTSVSKNWTGKKTDTFIQAENILCSPCHYTRWWLACGESRPCLSGIKPEVVANRIRLLIDRQ